jgi:hypothetical protein
MSCSYMEAATKLPYDTFDLARKYKVYPISTAGAEEINILGQQEHWNNALLLQQGLMMKQA